MTMAIPIPAPSVAVFNADYSPLPQVDYRAAVSMLARKVAYALEQHDPPRMLRSPSASIELPRSLMLKAYVHIPYQRLADHASRAEILDRDHRLCQFVGCGARATTIDHLLPRCRGGGNTWLNLVAQLRGLQRSKRGPHTRRGGHAPDPRAVPARERVDVFSGTAGGL